MTVMKITKSKVDRLKPGDKPIWDTDVKGFGVRVSSTGQKTYVVAYRPKPGGRGINKRFYVIGAHGSPETVESARTEAKSILGRVADGHDPQAEHMTERKREGKTITELVPSFIKSINRQRSWKQVEKALINNFVPTLGKMRPEDIARKDIAGIVDTVAARAPVMAARTLSHIHRFMGWCIERGFIEINPAKGIKSPETPTSRERVLDDDELAEVWKAAEAVGWPWEGLVKLLTLTAQRRGEVTGMRWDEVEGSTWSIPGSRTKNKRSHKVPLTPTAAAVIEAQPKQGTKKGECPFVFTTNAETHVSGLSSGKRRIDKTILGARREAARKRGDDPAKVKPMPHWTYHDLRRTVTTGMARLGIHPHIADAILNHKQGTIRGVAAVYNRHRYESEARCALEAWEAHVIEIVTGTAPASNVVPLSDRR